MFGFGVALWELVTQEMPIRGALRDVRAPEECPAAVKSLINKCMARKPEMRPTAEEVSKSPVCCCAHRPNGSWAWNPDCCIPSMRTRCECGGGVEPTERLVRRRLAGGGDDPESVECDARRPLPAGCLPREGGPLEEAKPAISSLAAHDADVLAASGQGSTCQQAF